MNIRTTLIVAGLLLSLTGRAQICFQQNPMNYASGTGQNFLTGCVSGNFTADGNPDVAVAYTNKVRIKNGDGTGLLTNGLLLNIGLDNVYDLKAADMDNDGLDDIVVLNVYCLLHVYYNNGNGTFADSVYTGGSLFGSGDMFVADFNNDNFKDVLMVGGTSTLYMSSAARSYAPQPVSLPYTPDAACVGNWNNDAFTDILVTDNGALTPLTGQGNGTFVTGSNITFPINLFDLTLADMNNDSYMDVISGAGFDVTVHYRDASGAIVQTDQITTNGSVLEYLNPDEIVVADLEQDQYPEILLASQWNSNVMVVNNQSGVLSAREYACTGGAAFLAIQDINLDGRSDIVTASSGLDGYLSILLGDTGTSFQATEYVSALNGAVQDFETMAAGDLNGDGFKDLVTFGFDTVLVLINDGSGGFSAPLKFAAPFTGSGGSPVLLDDFNNDGKNDVVITDLAEHLYLYRGLGNGSFLSPQVIQAPGYLYWAAMVSGKFNNDTIPDIAYGTSNQIKVLLNNGTGAFTAAGTISTTSYAYSLFAGDYNEDGVDDIVFTNQFTGGSLYISNGNGVFTAGGGFSSCINGSMSAVCGGDLNHDGHLDVAFTDYDCTYPDRVMVAYGNGAGGLTSGLNLNVYETPYHVKIADINLDGYNDVIANSATGIITVRFYNPQLSNFSVAYYLASGPASATVLVDDLNNDLKPDLAYVNVESRNIGVSLNDIARIEPAGFQYLCAGDSILLHTSNMAPGITWNNGATNDSIYITSPGWYYLTDTSLTFGSCFGSATLYVAAHTVTPPVFSSINNPDSVCANTIVPLVATPGGGTFTGQGVFSGLFNTAFVSPGNSYAISYSYTDSTGCTSSAVTHSIYVDACIGLEEVQRNVPVVFPNPSGDFVEIQQHPDARYDRLEVMDLFGRRIESRALHSDRVVVQVKDMRQGSYQLIFTDTSGKLPVCSTRITVIH